MAEQKEYSQFILGEELKILKVNTYGCLLLAFFCAYLGFESAFPWLTTQVGLPWTAWGFSKTGYTMKSTKQNTAGGITYEMAMLAAQTATKTKMNAETEETVTDL